MNKRSGSRLLRYTTSTAIHHLVCLHMCRWDLTGFLYSGGEDKGLAAVWPVLPPTQRIEVAIDAGHWPVSFRHIPASSSSWCFSCMLDSGRRFRCLNVMRALGRSEKMNWAERLREGMHGLAESLGNLLMEAFHYLALFAIGAITAWAGVMTFIGMLEKGHITVDDILLLFIYLELAAMVGIYFKTNHMPIRFMIYVAITALTRLLISDISHTHKPS